MSEAGCPVEGVRKTKTFFGILYCGERSHDSNLRWWSLNSIHTGQAAHRLYKLRTLVEFALVKDHV